MKLFILCAFPLTLVVFHLARRYRPGVAAAVLLLASLAFYAVADRAGLPLLLCSIVFNYWISGRVLRAGSRRAWWVFAGVVLNLLPLIFYKYLRPVPLAGSGGLFVVAGIPLGLSFYTFQQITCLFDIQRPGAMRLPFVRHALFAGFFAQIPAGPVSKYRDLAPQMAGLGFSPVSARMILSGASLFLVGLGKKMFVADALGGIVDPVHAAVAAGQQPGLLQAWVTAWTFVLQIYFDFSGYSDMAIGAALCFGLILHINFNSPLKAISGSDFVGRWHMSLVGWIREYLYQPIFRAVRRLPFQSAHRKRIVAWAVATVASMTVIGAWHGRQLALVLEGLVGGILLVMTQLPSLLRPAGVKHHETSFSHHLLQGARRLRMLAVVSVLGLTMRAGSMGALLTFLHSMVNWRAFTLPAILQSVLPAATASRLHFENVLPQSQTPVFDGLILLAATGAVFLLPNTMQVFDLLPKDLAPVPSREKVVSRVWQPSMGWGLVIGGLALLEIVCYGGGGTGFIYANF